MENEEKLQDLASECSPTTGAALSDEELAEVSGGKRSSVMEMDKHKHYCPICENPIEIEDWEWNRKRGNSMVHCDKCRNSYPKSQWKSKPGKN